MTQKLLYTPIHEEISIEGDDQNNDEQLKEESTSNYKEGSIDPQINEPEV